MRLLLLVALPVKVRLEHPERVEEQDNCKTQVRKNLNLRHPKIPSKLKPGPLVPVGVYGRGMLGAIRPSRSPTGFTDFVGDMHLAIGEATTKNTS